MNAGRVFARMVLVCVGVPFTAVVGFATAVPPFLGASDQARDTIVWNAAVVGCLLVLGATLFTLAYVPALRRAYRAPARVSNEDRARLQAAPRHAAQGLFFVAAVVLAVGSLHGRFDVLGPLRIPAAASGAAALLMAALVLYPTVGFALQPLLESIAAPRNPSPVAPADRLSVRVALAVGIPTGVAALLAGQIVAAHLDATARTEEEASARAYSLALGVPGVPGENRLGFNSAAAVLTAGGVSLTPGVQYPQAQVRSTDPPDPSFTIPLALALAGLGAALGWLVGRGAALELHAATLRVESVTSHRIPLEPTHGSVPEVQGMARALDVVAARLAAMAADQRRALTVRAETARLRAFVLAGVSHDLRGPLNAVLGFAGLLLSGVDGAITAGQRESLEALTRGGRDLLRLVDDLLDSARLDAGRLTVERESVAIGSLLDAARLAALERVGRAVGPDAAQPAEGDLGATIVVDRDRAARALGALIAYALQRPGAGATVATRVRAASDGRVVIAIAGSGTTPNRESLAQILAPFDVAPSGARAPAGLGLAVGVARQVIELHGGTVKAEAIRDGGLLIVVELRGPTPPAREALDSTAVP